MAEVAASPSIREHGRRRSRYQHCLIIAANPYKIHGAQKIFIDITLVILQDVEGIQVTMLRKIA